MPALQGQVQRTRELWLGTQRSQGIPNLTDAALSPGQEVADHANGFCDFQPKDRSWSGRAAEPSRCRSLIICAPQLQHGIMDRARMKSALRLVCLHLVAFSTVLLAAMPIALAQTARKPSPYEARQGATAPATDNAQAPAQLPRIANRVDFMRLARVYNPGTPLEMPHLIFTIDRRDPARIYYINTPRYELHENFVRRERLLPQLDKAALNAQYRDPQRRFLFGTV
ncbi:MAG: hypothetical protein RR326_18840, partial [Stenotrophomonas sp.]